MNRCPRCNGESGFELNEHVTGWWKTLVEWDGKIFDTNLDNLKHRSRPKTALCMDCFKRVNIENIEII